MVLNEEENVYRLINFDDGCLEKCLDVVKRKYLMDFDDFESGEECENLADLLPNDPFDMEFNMGLPSDPFLMDFNLSLPKDPFGIGFDIEATVEAITGWIEDFDLKAYEFETDGAVEGNGNDDNSLKASEDAKIFAELNFVWTSSVNHEQENLENKVVGSGSMMCTDDGSYNDLMCFGCEKYKIEENVKHDKATDSGAAVDAIVFVLGYLNLGLTDLLSVEMVCKSLRDAVRKDPYIWTKIHIDYPLSLKITNDDLLRLTDRAQGKLRSLSLVKCFKITIDGLKEVLERNLKLIKLSVAGSIKLGAEGMLQNLKVFNSVALPGIKCLRIGELIGLTNEHLNEFKLLLGADVDASPNDYRPRFYRAEEIYLSLDDERAIDVETCPKCQKLGQVYDCPTEDCLAKKHATETCRACIFCIARCMRCGCCLDNKDYEETFCFDFLCFDCLKELFNFEGVVPYSPGPTYFHQMGSYHFFVYS